jgi:hypothetical protein
MKQSYQIAIVGMSGKGKTYSFRNMNPETCGYINSECKPLPFPNTFLNYCTPSNWQNTYQKLIDYAKEEKITEVVLDSFSAYVEDLLLWSRDKYKNFDVWNFYNAEISKLLFVIRNYPKDIFIVSHYENIEDVNGVIEKRIAVKGREHKAVGIERDFTIVVFTDVIKVDNKRNYIFNLLTDGVTTAKTPPMFLIGEYESDITENDCNKFLQHIHNTLNKK